MVFLKKSDLLTPSFDEQLDQSKKASFLKREKERLTVREGQLFHFVKQGDKSRINKGPAFTKEEVNKKNKNGHTSLVVAVEAGKYEIAKELIKNLEADVNVSFGKDKDTALHLACMKASQNTEPDKQKDRDKMVDLLLKHGANYDALNKNLQTPIAFCTGKQKDEQFLDTCVSQCITYESFVESVRGGLKKPSGDDKNKKQQKQEI